MVPHHKLNDVLETETQHVSVSTEIGVWKWFCSVSRKKVQLFGVYGNGNVFPGNTFPFPEKNMFQL
jgi:hypothetical protein